ncbi:conserved hypothetical protein [Paraburkholderia sabiae]|uniref:hypothetical protein n=1 Tax=Paraburkholderia sabiae TaxID=273251 RepID=UPI001CAE9AAA|nr:hypothetical protein [Paraburkholderia sabiae]CAG9213294.1 conserved hypothetical protein [Paraburkholderia sabiae]
MNATITTLFRTTDDLTQRYVVRLLCAYHAGGLACSEATVAAGESAGADDTGDIAGVEEAYGSLLLSPKGGVLEVPPERTKATALFMRDARGTLKELSCAIIVVSPCDESQQRAISIMDALSLALEAGQMRAMFVDCPSDVSAEVAFEQVFHHMRERQSAAPEEQSVLSASRAFQNAHDHKLDFASLLHGGNDIETELVETREKGGSIKKLRHLARRVMAARSVLAMVPEYRRAFDLLGLNRISPEEWHARRGVTPTHIASHS